MLMETDGLMGTDGNFLANENRASNRRMNGVLSDPDGNRDDGNEACSSACVDWLR
jgi:hypothetical protein